MLGVIGRYGLSLEVHTVTVAVSWRHLFDPFGIAKIGKYRLGRALRSPPPTRMSAALRAEYRPNVRGLR